MTEREYRKLDAVNWSTLKAMADSPAHYLAALHTERQDTPALRFGRIVDVLLFTPDLFRDRFAIVPFDDFRTKDAKAWKAEAEDAGLDVVKPAEVDEARTLADAVRAHPIARRYLDAGRFQVPLVWTDSETGLRCKGLADLVGDLDGGFLIDGKSARTIEKRRYLSQAATLGYHCQLAHYRSGYVATFGQPPAFIGHIVYEKGQPHDVGVLRFDRSVIDSAAVKVRELLALVAECRASNRWPGRYPDVEEVTIDDLPRWLDDEDESADDLGITATF